MSNNYKNSLQQVHLRKNYELEVFHSSHNEYLLITQDKHFKVNCSVYNLIRILEKQNNVEKIAEEYSLVQKKTYTAEDIDFIITTSLVPLGIIDNGNAIELIKTKSFLWFQKPLLSEKILHVLSSVLKCFFYPNVAKLTISIILVSHIVYFISFYKFENIVALFENPNLLFYSSAILFISCFFHELGHISAAKYFGIKHKEVGIGIYLLFPVLYSNISDSWRLTGKKRAVIDIAGLYFQFILNVVFLLIYIVFYRNDLLLLIISIVVFQSIVVLNPFFRFDGYWLATDLMGVPNLRKQSTEFLKYMYNKYIRNKPLNDFKFSANKKSKFLFIFYSLFSNVFIGYILLLMLSKMPSSIIEFPGYAKETFKSLIIHTLNNEWNGFALTSYQFIMHLLFIGICLYFVFRILLTIAKMLYMRLSTTDNI